MNTRLVSAPGAEMNLAFALQGRRVSVGREDDNMIQLPHEKVSKHHAVLVAEAGDWVIEDLQSTNGTLVNGKPAFMARDAKAANAGGTYYIKKGEEVPFDDSKFKVGDEVASIIINPLTGTDRGDVRTANTYANGMHTAVVSRKLVTGSKFDVQFADMGARYGFGFAAFDNAQVRHATSDDPMYLVFGKK